MRKTPTEAKETLSKRRLVSMLATAAIVIGVVAPVSASVATADEWTCVPAIGYTCFDTNQAGSVNTDQIGVNSDRLGTSEWICVPAHGYTCFRADSPTGPVDNIPA